MPRYTLTLLLAAALLAACAPAAPAPTAPTSEVFAQRPEGAETSEVSPLTATPTATLTPTPEPGLEDAPPGSYKDDETDDVYDQEGKLIYTKVGSEWVKVIEQPAFPDLRNEGLVDIQAIGEEMFSVDALNGRLEELGVQVNAQGKIVDECGSVISEDLTVNSDGTVNFTWRYTDEAGKQVADMDVFHAGNVRVVDGQLYVAGYRWDGATGSWKAEQNAFPLENPEAQVGVFYLGDIANGNWARFMDRALKEMGPEALDALFAGADVPTMYEFMAKNTIEGDFNGDGQLEAVEKVTRRNLVERYNTDFIFKSLKQLTGRGQMGYYYCPDAGTVIEGYVYQNAQKVLTPLAIHHNKILWGDLMNGQYYTRIRDMAENGGIAKNRLGEDVIVNPTYILPESPADYSTKKNVVNIMPNFNEVEGIVSGKQDGSLDPALSLVSWGAELVVIVIR